MRRDLIIGIIVSLAFHVGILGGSYIFNPGPHKAPPPPEVPKIDIVLPPPPPPDQPPVDENQPQEDANEVAPPSQIDLPQVVPINAMTQQIEPPPPPGMQVGTAITIPTTRPTGFGRGFGHIFNLSDLDQTPRPTVQISPQYPFEMRRAGISGTVVVEFLVDTNGNVQQPYVVSSTQREFEASALQAVSKWKFTPGRKNGRAVVVRMQLPIAFNIDSD